MKILLAALLTSVLFNSPIVQAADIPSALDTLTAMRDQEFKDIQVLKQAFDAMPDTDPAKPSIAEAGKAHSMVLLMDDYIVSKLNGKTPVLDSTKNMLQHEQEQE